MRRKERHLAAQIVNLFELIDFDGSNKTSWEEFTTFLVDRGMIKDVAHEFNIIKVNPSTCLEEIPHQSHIEKAFYFEHYDKVAFRWHDGAGSRESVRAMWPWPFAATFFDWDGSVTTPDDDMGGTTADHTAECKRSGCYLHSDFRRSGTYIGKAVKVSLLRQKSSSMGKCMDPLVGGRNSKVIQDADITASSTHSNGGRHGCKQMWRSRINSIDVFVGPLAETKRVSFWL